jgi:cytochrome c oxidase assembly factor CtaG
MDPLMKAALSSWDLRLEVIIPLALLSLLFIRGWARLRRRSSASGRASTLGAWWRPICYVAGIGVIVIALLSPIDVLVQQLFFVHMLQHMLLITIIPWLLLLPNPMPFLLWGLPDRLRLPVGHLISDVVSSQSATGRMLRKAANPGAIWLFLVISIYAWHDPDMYNLALRSEFIHDIEHLCFFVAGMIFWWYAIGAGPRINKPLGKFGRIAFIVAAVPPNMGLGMFLAFSNEVIYTYYNDAPRLWGISVLDDQRLSGVLMWVPGSMMYLMAALVLIAGVLTQEHDKPIESNPAWDIDGAATAPGLSHTGGRP